MCKLNQFLPLLLCCAQLVQIGVTSPLGSLLFDDYEDEPTNDDYDLHYDERQNGTENYRLNINGVLIAVPGPSNNAMNSVGLLASNYLLELAEAAAANDEGVDDVENDDPPYEFEIPVSSPENIDADNNEGSQPVVVIPADGIIKPEQNDSAILDLKPEHNADAVNEKESSTNKKDLNVEIEKETQNLKTKPEVAETSKKQMSTPATRQVAHKVGTKRRNKLKQRIGALLNYLKRSRE